MSAAAGPPRWMLFCESAGDFRTVEALVDELLRLWCATWVGDTLDRDPADARRWWHHQGTAGWYNLHRVYDDADELDIRRHQGHFAGEPGLPGAVMLDTMFRIVRKVHGRVAAAERPSAVVVLWDADDQGHSRRMGLDQALAHVTLPVGVEHVVALADPEREAWVLAGFEPEDEDEEAALYACRTDLGYAPHEHAHRLTAGSGAAKDDSKRVLGALCTTQERERICLRIPDHERRAVLLTRGANSGLATWITHVEDRLLPQVDPAVVARLLDERAP